MTHFRDGNRNDLEALRHLDHSLLGGVLSGLEGIQIDIQGRAIKVLNRPTSWRSATSITGMATGSIRESVQRISGAFSKFHIPDPQVELLINLAPADLPKNGTWLDLPLAVIMLQIAGFLPDLRIEKESQFLLFGEIGLHGEIRRVPGALSLAFTAKPGQSLIMPAGNEKESALILAKPGHEGCKILPVSSLADVIAFFRGQLKLKNATSEKISFEPVIPKCIDLSGIRGQAKAKKAAVIAAAGAHNLLLIGPPGEGKSLLASAIPGILPSLTNDEKVELTKIYSACGRLDQDGQAVTRRPMRSIHQTISKQALVGGGSGVPQPGEITLAHHGVLFIDEIAEFSAATLDSLRQPMESGEIQITRVGGSFSYPSRFTLVAAMNPCPCGYYGEERCRCRPQEVAKYIGKLSGPIVDRIDLQVEMSRLSLEERFSESKGQESPEIRHRVQKARETQRRRFAGTGITTNASIPGGHVREYCRFDESGFDRYRTTIENSSLSTRTMDRLAKVSRTIADLLGDEFVTAHHVEEATTYVVDGPLKK